LTTDIEIMLSKNLK